MLREFTSLERLFALEGPIISKSSISEVLIYRAQGRSFYVKRFYQSRKSWGRFFRVSRCRTEWQNLKFLASLGIPTLTPLAFFEETWWGGLYPRRAALVTEEIPKAIDLKKLAEKHPEYLRNPAWRSEVFSQLANALAKLHATAFAHKDLHWRNILLTLEAKPQVYLFDLPQGRKYSAYRLSYFIRKDLKQLDKLAAQYLSKTQRLAFFLEYRGKRRLIEEDKQILRSILN